MQIRDLSAFFFLTHKRKCHCAGWCDDVWAWIFTCVKKKWTKVIHCCQLINHSNQSKQTKTWKEAKVPVLNYSSAQNLSQSDDKMSAEYKTGRNVSEMHESALMTVALPAAPWLLTPAAPHRHGLWVYICRGCFQSNYQENQDNVSDS